MMVDTDGKEWQAMQRQIETLEIVVASLALERHGKYAKTVAIPMLDAELEKLPGFRLRIVKPL